MTGSRAGEEIDGFEQILQIAQGCVSSVPVLVLGSGASSALGIRGMGPLAECLVSSIAPTSTDRDVWEQFKADLTTSQDLEGALQRVTITDNLLRQIIACTRKMVHEDDFRLFEDLICRKRQLALSRLLKHLFNSTHETVSVVTTNYDRVAEYAANLAKTRFDVGFSDGYLRQFIPPPTGVGRHTARRGSRCVEIWKVHGSVDWFSDDQDSPLAIPHGDKYPDTFTPLIVTPGVSKYARTHQEPFRSIISRADAALTGARGYLCIGYGFSDTHIEPKLVQRAIDERTPIVILAKELRSGAKTFLARCQHPRVLALEECPDGTRAYCHKHPEGLVLPGRRLWDFDDFLTAIGV